MKIVIPRNPKLTPVKVETLQPGDVFAHSQISNVGNNTVFFMVITPTSDLLEAYKIKENKKLVFSVYLGSPNYADKCGICTTQYGDDVYKYNSEMRIFA